MEWHVQVGGVQSGPHAESEVAEWARTGRLKPTDVVWSPGMPGWVLAHNTQPFAGVFAGHPVSAPAKLGDDPIERLILPVGVSGWAMAAGYVGLFSVLLFPAPFALALGIMAVIDIKRHSSDKHGLGRAIFGIIMGAVFSALLIHFLVIRPF